MKVVKTILIWILYSPAALMIILFVPFAFIKDFYISTPWKDAKELNYKLLRWLIKDEK